MVIKQAVSGIIARMANGFLVSFFTLLDILFTQKGFLFFQVLTSNLAIQKESYIEKDNLWIGPRQVSYDNVKMEF